MRAHKHIFKPELGNGDNYLIDYVIAIKKTIIIVIAIVLISKKVMVMEILIKILATNWKTITFSIKISIKKHFT